jgi:hypothetical protein
MARGNTKNRRFLASLPLVLAPGKRFYLLKNTQTPEEMSTGGQLSGKSNFLRGLCKITQVKQTFGICRGKNFLQISEKV